MSSTMETSAGDAGNKSLSVNHKDISQFYGTHLQLPSDRQLVDMPFQPVLGLGAV